MAQELGYTPNAMARRLTSGRTETVGFVVSEIELYYGDPYFPELLAGISEVFTLSGYDLSLVIAPTPRTELYSYRRLVEERRVDCVILDRVYRDDPRVDFMLSRRFPFVTFGRDRRAAEHAYLDIDNERAFEVATERLIAHGHRRIALIAADPAFAFVAQRVAGYRTALALSLIHI